MNTTSESQVHLNYFLSASTTKTKLKIEEKYNQIHWDIV
jgi:hypothetical protein